MGQLRCSGHRMDDGIWLAVRAEEIMLSPKGLLWFRSERYEGDVVAES